MWMEYGDRLGHSSIVIDNGAGSDKTSMGNLVTVTSAFSTQSYKKEISIFYFYFF